MQMFRANCGKCRSTFDVAMLPMPILDFARAAKGRACPVCGNIEGNTCAEARPLTPDETAQKLKIDAQRAEGR